MRTFLSALVLASLVGASGQARAEATLVSTHAIYPGNAFGRAYGAKITVSGP